MAQAWIYIWLRVRNEWNERVPFRELIGSLMFFANITRSNISFAVNVLSRFLNSYSEWHWQSAKRILRYLKGTIEYGILYVCDKKDVSLSCYSDAGYAGDVSMRRSPTGEPVASWHRVSHAIVQFVWMVHAFGNPSSNCRSSDDHLRVIRSPNAW